VRLNDRFPPFADLQSCDRFGCATPDFRFQRRYDLPLVRNLARYDTRRGRPEPIVRPRGGAQRPGFAEAIARLEQRLKGLGYEVDEEALPPRADDAEAA
jgi:hypothetical protein